MSQRTVSSPPPRQGGMGGGPMAGLQGVSDEKAQDFRGSLKRFAARMRPERVIVALVIVLAFASVFLAVLGPKLLGNATNIIFDGFVSSQLPSGVTQEQAVAALEASGQTDQASMVASMTLTPGEGVDFAALARILAIATIVYVLSSILSWGQNYLMAGVTQRTIYRLREEVDAKLGKLPLRYFDSSSRGDVLSRVTNDIDNISMTLQQTLTQLITALLTVIGVLAMMVWISPILAVISLLTVPLSFAVTMFIAKRSQPHFVAQWKWTGTLNGHVEETFSGHDLVKVFGHRHQSIADFDEANERMYESSFRAQYISGIIQPALTVIANLNYVAIAVIGGLRVATGSMSLGDVQAFIQYSRQFTMPITQIAGVANVLQSGIASAERVFELLDQPEETPDDDPSIPLDAPTGRIRFEDVSFRYLPDAPLIEGFDLSVEPGEIIAIVGPTGAGKTTLVNLLMRFYDVDSGRILMDGEPTMGMRRDDVRRSFGMVLQDTWLFEGTIHDNIAYGAADATEEEIDAAARAARVDHFVRTLPDGYETLLTEGASNISAGERQLLTIARAFLADPAILILDEATSSVDTRTEVLIQQAMAELRHGRTSFVIAHRLSTIRNADVIVVLESGRIVEQGSHDELIAAKGAYYRLYRSQFESAVDDGE
ncbi:MAG: ATP-binding cassette, subfamily multidrug efflux pump [Actinomycetota bacterium]|jgi:ATP-binding cassette subfamily B protein|nr:ATP-binding cassette, subfamily multidrug efflux pump [Actinomycetota bacterium]